MRLSLVVAFDRNRIIGHRGELPWHLPDDLRRFRAITMGKPIAMGRRTHESIGRALPGRRNLVLTSRTDYVAPGCEVFASLQHVLSALDVPELMVIGGAALYAEAFPICTRIYLTEVEAELEGDVYFPAFARDQWREISAEHHAADERHAWPFWFRVLQRISTDARTPGEP